MPFVDFELLAAEELAPGHSTARGAVVAGKQIQMGRVHFAKGGGAREHAHAHEQMIYVLRGRLRAVSGGEERILVAGQGAYHPAHVPHQVEALEDTELLSCKAIIADG